jgi:stage II sporulation protein D
MKILLLISHFLLLTSLSFAEDTIKVLIIEGPDSPILTENAEKIGNLKGEIFINGYRYNGFVDIRRDENGLHFINELPFEKYIEGVVAAETGKNWAIEALKAQAVISRTYAFYQKLLNVGKDYQITSSVLHQAYKGDNTNEAISRAVRETSGEILTYEDRPIEAFYHSTCQGKTELPEEVWGKNYPYLKSVPCMDKNSPYEHWVRRFSLDEVEKVLGINRIRDVRITSFTSTGRARILKVVIEDSYRTENSEIEIKATDLRKLLGYRELPSTQFSVIIEDRDVIFEGNGYGHGVGLSQWGALELANEGKSYKEILEYYYPGTIIEKR